MGRLPGGSPGGGRRRLAVVLVRGPSMLPTLHPGDCLVVRPRRAPRRGDVVVARFAARPDLVVVKRADRPAAEGGWLVQGDNPDIADDSRRYGPADVLATVAWRYWPPSRLGRVPRRP